MAHTSEYLSKGEGVVSDRLHMYRTDGISKPENRRVSLVVCDVVCSSARRSPFVNSDNTSYFGEIHLV